MEIEVRRHAFKPTYTIGKMYVDGKYLCDTLEDVVRKGPKVMHETAIPAGRYEVILNKSPRFGKVLPRLLNVPGFDGILIHSGNASKDTSGCILVGQNKEVGRVINSQATMSKLMALLEPAAKKGKIFITVK